MTTTTVNVIGMTCEHCVAAVTQELTALDGVRSVDVELVVGGISTATVTSDRPLADAAVRTAVDEAGYELAEG